MGKQTLNFYRVNIIAGGVVVALFWFVHKFTDPNSIDPIFFRVLFAGISFFIVGISFISEVVRKNIYYFFFPLILLINVWLGYLVFLNNGEISYVIAQVLWTIVLASYFESFKTLTVYSIVTILVSWIVMMFLPSPMISETLYLSAISAGIGINYVSNYGKFRLQSRLEASNKELEKFRLIIANAGEHIIITDKDGKIIFANKAVERITGYSNAEVIGKRPSLWGAQMPKEFYQNMWDTIKNKKQRFQGEITNKRKNGELYVAESDIAPILDENGNVEYFVGIERDITQFRKAQKELQDKFAEVSRLNSLMIGRELKMVELKKEIAKLTSGGLS